MTNAFLHKDYQHMLVVYMFLFLCTYLGILLFSTLTFWQKIFVVFLTQRIHNNSTFSFGVNFLQSHHDINIDLPIEFFHIKSFILHTYTYNIILMNSLFFHFLRKEYKEWKFILVQHYAFFSGNSKTNHVHL